MSSHRYYIGLLPVEHINGKLAPIAVKCPDWDGEHESKGYFYGYRLRFSKVSRYGLRTKSRNLQVKPYTAGEIDNRATFTDALHAVREHFGVLPDWSLMLADFERQNEYATARGYAIAECRKNGGTWLDKWR